VKNETFVPTPVSFMLSAASGPVTVAVKLYGPVTTERIDAEKRNAQHRADQLNMTRPISRPREFVPDFGEYIE
jgi:hypothetical protein